jgi:hypothetical protein
VLWDVYADIPARERRVAPSLAAHDSGRALQHREAYLFNF